jgi:hypothetical protein
VDWLLGHSSFALAYRKAIPSSELLGRDTPLIRSFTDNLLVRAPGARIDKQKNLDVAPQTNDARLRDATALPTRRSNLHSVEL